MPKLSKGPKRRPWAPPKEPQQRRLETEFDYNSPRWRADRRLHLQEEPLCRICVSKGLTVEATVSDHVNPVRTGGDPWDRKNRQSLCKTCHDRKSGREGHARPGRGG